MSEIRQTYSYLKERKEWWEAQIKDLQEKCPHESVVVRRGADTDNWDYSESYWVVINCQDCGLVKRYDRDGNPMEYYKYMRRVNEHQEG